jgi:hypothetical protein
VDNAGNDPAVTNDASESDGIQCASAYLSLNFRHEGVAGKYLYTEFDAENIAELYQ